MAFSMYYNQFNTPKTTKSSARKRSSKVTNRSAPSLSSIKEASRSQNETTPTNKESSPISLPKSIPFIRDNINKQWMQSKMRKFKYEYGFKISDNNWLPTPHSITLSDAISGPLQY